MRRSWHLKHMFDGIHPSGAFTNPCTGKNYSKTNAAPFKFTKGVEVHVTAGKKKGSTGIIVMMRSTRNGATPGDRHVLVLRSSDDDHPIVVKEKYCELAR